MNEDDDEPDGRPAWWQQWQVSAGVFLLALALGIWVWVLHAKHAERLEEIVALERRIETGPLHPPSNLRTVKVTPARRGPAPSPQVVLSKPDLPDLVELRINVSFAKQRAFRVLVERPDPALAGSIHNLLRDSNGELRLSINTSALYPGVYQLRIEGLVNRGEPVPIGWVTAKVSR